MNKVETVLHSDDYLTKGWVGCDLDGTLALYDGWQGPTHIGAPIPKMLALIKSLLRRGVTVKIFTARISCRSNQEKKEVTDAIHAWCVKNGLPELEVTCTKDYSMSYLIDDRALQVTKNTGEFVTDLPKDFDLVRS